MIKITAFAGGLNTRLAPELVAENEAVEAINVNIDDGQIVSARGVEPVSEDRDAYPYWFEAEDRWFGAAHIRSYQAWNDRLYWTLDTGGRPYKYDPAIGVPTYLGIYRPVSPPSLGVGGPGNPGGTLRYVYTYYNANDGTESAPSDPQSIYVASQSVFIGVQASTEAQVTHIRIYRVGGNVTEFMMVMEISNVTQTVNDNIDDTNLPGPALPSNASDNWPPLNDLRYLVHHRHLWFAAKDNVLYFTDDRGDPNYWPQTNYIEFEAEITGLATTGEALVVFTRNRSYAVVGNSALSLSKYLISADQGCLNHRSIAYMGYTALFVSAEGICTTQGTDVKVLSRGRLGTLEVSPVVAVVYRERYYLLTTDHRILEYSLAYEPHFLWHTYGISPRLSWLYRGRGRLWASHYRDHYEMFAGDPVQLTWETGNLTEGSDTMTKAWGGIKLSFDGTFTVDVLVNNVTVLTKVVDSSVQPTPYLFAVPADKQLGTNIRLRFIGVGRIREIHIYGQYHGEQGHG